MLLAKFPRVRFSHSQTALEPMDRLRAALGVGPKLYIKRDDCTGLATGGNKSRKLEFLVADAQMHGSDVLVTVGAVQSNHVRMTAAAAMKFGMDCHAVFEKRVADAGQDYEENGNILLDNIFGCTASYVANGTDMNVAAALAADELRKKGHKPYVIPGGGSNEIGALGYVDCAYELTRQANDMDLDITRLVHGTGSSGTQAGLVAGLASINSSIKTYGISVRHPKEKQETMVFGLADRTAAFLGLPGSVKRADVVADDRFVGPGYGMPTPEMIDAIKLLARTEGILLDPVYSGKAMAGFIQLIKEGAIGSKETAVFLHTGGSSALFGYKNLFSTH